VNLVKRGHDVVAVAADPALAGLPDDQLLAWAGAQRRCLVTENVREFEILRRQSVAQGATHPGLLYSGPGGFRETGGSSAPWSPPWTTCSPPGRFPSRTR
jgi:Domain of unknown function (DUF5615)